MLRPMLQFVWGSRGKENIKERFYRCVFEPVFVCA